MSKIVAIANQKGGIGKSTTAQNLAAAYTQKGFITLLIDLDPQSNVTISTGTDQSQPGTYEMIAEGVDISKVIQTIRQGFYIIPSNNRLGNIERELTQTGREYKLKELLAPILNNFDRIVIDYPTCFRNFKCERAYSIEFYRNSCPIRFV